MSSYKKRTIIVADTIKQMVVTENLKPGDRLPAETELIQRFKMSKGTMREATRLLEAQGLIKTRTGPGGGCFVHEVSELRTIALLSNYFYFKNLNISDIYQIRKLLEPEVAGSLAGNLKKEQLKILNSIISEYQEEPVNEEQDRIHHESALKFHGSLADFANNSLLGFVIKFMAQMLTEVTVNRELFRPTNYELWRRGLDFHRELLTALEVGDSNKAKKIMYEHMCVAEKLMLKQEAMVSTKLKELA